MVYIYHKAFLVQLVKNPPAMWETWVQSLGGEDPLEKGMGYLLQYSCLVNPHGQRCQVNHNPWGRKQLDN